GLDGYFLHTGSAKAFERERRLEGAVHGSRPRRPQRTFGARELDDLVMLPSTQALRDDGEGTGGEGERGGEVGVQFGVAGLLAVGLGEDRDGLAAGGEIPPGEVEEVDGLLQDPVADTANVIAPAVGAQAVGLPPQLDESVEWLADGPSIEQLL